MSRLILGINSAHPDAAAALVGENGIIAAIAEERISRRKHCGGFPRNAIAEVLRIAGAAPSDISDIAVARNPKANLARKIAYVAQQPFRRVPHALQRFQVHRDVRGAREHFADALGVTASQVRANFHGVEHHVAHAASAFFWSPFDSATAVTVDGAGDFATSLVATCRGNSIRVHRRTIWPHSLGVFYTAICQFIGFDRFGEEYKVMGLSAYGVNRFVPEMRRLVSLTPVGGIHLALEYFRHTELSEEPTSRNQDEIEFPRLWGDRMQSLLGAARKRTEPLQDRHNDIAASLQCRFEEVYLEHLANSVKLTGIRDVVMAGGCALNSVANGRLLTERTVDRAYFHPAASDDGTAAGAALFTAHATLRIPRVATVEHAYWGTSWSDQDIETALQELGHPYRRLAQDDLVATAAAALAQGKIMGWFQGREEWGPRALGNRSILCHPGWPDMKSVLNARIKNREPFRPFAPAVLAERLNTCFMGHQETPYMIVVYRVRPEWKARLSAVTHEDGTARVQTVRREQNPLYYDLITRFESLTGTPVVLNTSFNENEPIVHTPREAIECFLRTKMDALGIGSFWLDKTGAN